MSHSMNLPSNHEQHKITRRKLIDVDLSDWNLKNRELDQRIQEARKNMTARSGKTSAMDAEIGKGSARAQAMVFHFS